MLTTACGLCNKIHCDLREEDRAGFLLWGTQVTENTTGTGDCLAFVLINIDVACSPSKQITPVRLLAVQCCIVSTLIVFDQGRYVSTPRDSAADVSEISKAMIQSLGSAPFAKDWLRVRFHFIYHQKKIEKGMCKVEKRRKTLMIQAHMAYKKSREQVIEILHRLSLLSSARAMRCLTARTRGQTRIFTPTYLQETWSRNYVRYLLCFSASSHL